MTQPARGQGSDPGLWERRSFLLGLGASLSFPLFPSFLLPEEEPELKRANPYGPLENYRYLRRLWRPGAAEPLIRRLWKAFEETGKEEYGEWALIFVYHWWRMTPLGKGRLEISRIGIEMSERFAKQHPRHPAGYMWKAVHTGTEVLSLGVLNALHYIPVYRRALDEVIRLSPQYFFGGAYTLLAKLYVKLPPFPLSIGDLGKGEEYLEKARPYQEKRIALWYLVYAELELLRKGVEGARAWLTRMEAEIVPKDAFSLYSLVASLHDGELFLKALEEKTYDRYQWDPILAPIEPELIQRIERRYLKE